MNRDSSYKSLVALAMLQKFNTCVSLPLIETCGGIEGVFLEKEHTLHTLLRELNVNPATFDRKNALLHAEEELRYIEKHHINICSIEDHNYPLLLRECIDAPLVFFYKGTLKTENHSKYLAIVGTRKASDRCRERVGQIVRELSTAGQPPVIVSGLAFGIDGSAHQACLQQGLKTYAVLGHGLHTVYPASHRGMAEKIITQGGALISEFPCRSTILPVNFLRRNRIIAGICHSTLIAESAEKGGAMATARMAHSYQRDVLAIPGRPEDKMSAGCNLLIKQNIAALVENGKDVSTALGLLPAPVPYQTELNFLEGDENEVPILRLLTEKGCLDIDSLSHDSGIPVHELAALLLKLELENKVVALPGKNYILT